MPQLNKEALRSKFREILDEVTATSIKTSSLKESTDTNIFVAASTARIMHDLEDSGAMKKVFDAIFGKDKDKDKSKDKPPSSKSKTEAGASNFDEAFIEAETKYGLPAGLLKNIAKVESNFNPDAKSEAGAIGLMQFLPSTAKAYDIDPTDPIQAIDGAGRYMRDSLKTFRGDVGLAVASYHAGPKGVQQYIKGAPKSGVGPRTKDYVKNVTGSDLGEPASYAFEEPEEAEGFTSSLSLKKLDPGIYEDSETGSMFSIDDMGRWERWDEKNQTWLPQWASRPQREDEPSDNELSYDGKLYPPLESSESGAAIKKLPNTKGNPKKHSKKDTDVDPPFVRGAGKI